MPTVLTLFAQRLNAHDRITVLICRQMISCETLPHIFSNHTIRIYFSVYAMSEI